MFAASSMIKTPSAVILTSSRDEVKSEQPSETENNRLLTVYSDFQNLKGGIKIE